MVEGFALKHW